MKVNQNVKLKKKDLNNDIDEFLKRKFRLSIDSIVYSD
jgi:hypothetical protein